MRGITLLIAAAVALNCSMNVLADTSLQERDTHTENIDTEEISTGELSEEDAAAVFETPDESDTTEAFETLTNEEDIADGQNSAIESDTAEMSELPEISEETTEENAADVSETLTISEEMMETDTSEIVEKPTEESGVKDAAEEPQAELLEKLSQEAYIYNVSLPVRTKAYLDPGNLSGRGQIFSEQYVVENYGNTDVMIKIKNIDIVCHSSENVYEFSNEEIVESYSTAKKLNVNMVWTNQAENIDKVLNVTEGASDECVLLLKAAEYDENGGYVGLHASSIGLFCFTGTLNSNPNIVWEDGDLTVHFDYEIVYAGEDDSVVTKMEDEEEQENVSETEPLETEDTKLENAEAESTEKENTEIESEEAVSTETENAETGNTETKKENNAQE